MTPIRQSAVRRALAALAEKNQQLLSEQRLEIDVYIDHKLTPESFQETPVAGGLILHFIRYRTSDQWQVDQGNFSILAHL